MSRSARDVIRGKDSKKVKKNWMSHIIIILVVAAVILFLYPALINQFLRITSQNPFSQGSALFDWAGLIGHPDGGSYLFLLIFGGLLILLTNFSKQRKNSGSIEFSSTGEHGDAKMMSDSVFDAEYPSFNLDEKVSYLDIIKESEKSERPLPPVPRGRTSFADGGIVYDAREVAIRDGLKLRKDIKIHYNPFQIQNVVIGSVGSGKSTAVIGPSIISIGNSGDSMVINDTKGELYRTFANYLQSQGYEVFLINYESPVAGQMYNQMQYIIDRYNEGLPHLYTAKAAKILLKYINYMLYAGTEDSEELSDEEFDLFAITPSDSGVAIASIETYKKTLIKMIARIKESVNFENGDMLVAQLKLWFTYMGEISYEEFMSVNKPVEEVLAGRGTTQVVQPKQYESIKNNEYLYFRQEKVQRAALKLLDGCRKEIILEYFTQQRDLYQSVLEGYIEGSSPYRQTLRTIELSAQIVSELEGDGLLMASHVIAYLNEVIDVEETIYSGEEQEAVDNANTISGMIIESGQTDSKGEAIWIEAPKSLLTGVILFVARESHLENSKHLGSVYQILADLMKPVDPTNFKDSRTKWDFIMASLPDHDAISRAQAAFSSAQGNTRPSILVSTQTPMKLWSNDAVISQSSQTSIDVLDLVKKPVAIFLNVPGSDVAPTYTLLASLFIEQIYATLIKHAKSRKDGTLPRSVYMLLDEFGNMPKIPNMGSKIALTRSFNIKFTMIVQALQQLDTHYRFEKQTILGNSNWIYLMTNDVETAKEVSERMGSTTLEQSQVSTSSNKDGTSTSESTRSWGVQLYTPQQLMDESFQRGKGILLASRQNPRELELKPYYEWPVDLSNQRDDLMVRRPKDVVNVFSPTDYQDFTVAYGLFNNLGLLDSIFFHAVRETRKKTMSGKNQNEQEDDE